MLQKDFFTLVDGKHYDEIISAEILNGDKNLETFIYNFKYFMNEIRRARQGIEHDAYSWNWDEGGRFTMTSKKRFYTQGTMRVKFVKGTITFSQVSDKLFIIVTNGKES